jgi:alkylation response protein AidB-like acyl-CoA dehydrogenase
VYAVSDVENPRGSMYQVLVERKFEGLETHRLDVPSVPRIEIGLCRFNNVKIPKSNMLGGKGEGYNNLFNGLVA